MGDSGVVSVRPASAWDILFLLGELSAGAGEHHFSDRLGTAREQMSIALRCCRAILSRRRPLTRRRGLEFVAARHGDATIGVALAFAEWDGDGAETITVEYVVVDARFRGAGAATALMRHFVAAGERVQCWCTPWSVPMQRLLRKLGFKRAQKTRLEQNGELKTVLPALWQWRPDLRAPARLVRTPQAARVAEPTARKSPRRQVEQDVDVPA